MECVQQNYWRKLKKVSTGAFACRYLNVSWERKTFWAAPGCGNGRKSMQPSPQRMISHLRRHIKIPFRKFKCAIKFNLHLSKHLRNKDFPKCTLFYNTDTPAIRVSRIVWGPLNRVWHKSDSNGINGYQKNINLRELSSLSYTNKFSTF